MATKIQLRRDLSSNWASTNPVLAQGEPGVELDTNNIKIGDGVKAWNDLAYTVQDSGLEAVFVSMDCDYSQQPRISTDGINWTAEVSTGSKGTHNSSKFGINQIAIGNGVIVYRGYNNIADKNEIRYSSGPYQAAVRPDDDITRVGPNGENIFWKNVTFGGGYFVVSGYYYDTARNDYNYPIAAYSADGATWTKINIDLDYVKDIVDTQNTNYNNTAGGMAISSVTYGSTGWLFTLNYEYDNTNWQNSDNRLNPGAFYITSITTALNSSSYFATMPATTWSSWFDGHGWMAYYNTNLIYRNNASDPRQGAWTDIGWLDVLASLDNVYSSGGPWLGDYYGVDSIAAGEVDGVNYMAISDYYGVVYYTADQGTTWNYVTPGPAYAGITSLDNNVNGGIMFRNSSSAVDWGDDPYSGWHGEKIEISGSYVVELNGTWWIDHYDNGAGNWPLYHDKGLNNRLDSSGFGSLNIVEKYVSYGVKGDNTIILPDVNDIVVGQRIFGIDAVRNKEEIDGNWGVPNVITAVNSDTNRITLKYPLYQDFSNAWLYFQAVVKYTHGDQINDLIYGGGKFVAFGGDSNRAYFTTNMTDWHYTVYASNQGGYGSLGYGALDVKTNSLRKDSATITGITNSLTLGDTFNVNIVGMTDENMGMYDYYGATNFNEGTLSIDPSSGSWYLGTYDNARNRELAIYTYFGQHLPFGDNPTEDTFDYYNHATSVAIETENSMFYFDDYYGTFFADKISIGGMNSNYNDYYGYNHIDDIHFDGADIYTSDGYELTIYNYFAPVNSGGGVHIHWDDSVRVKVNGNGVTLTDHGYNWNFTNDNDGVLYAPISSDIDVGGYWTIGQGNGTAGYPFIGATDNIGPDAYDFVIQAGYRNGDTYNNYWYFNRDGNLTLPPSGNIDVAGYWLIGNDNARIYAEDIVTMGEVYDLTVQANTTQWHFLSNGKFKLPVNGDIVNSDDQSVLNQDIPQNLQDSNGDYTLQLSDRGKHIYKTGTGGIKIPENADVSFPIGTCITLVTGSTNSTTISPVQSGATLVILSKFGNDSSINIPADTYVTILKIETDKWIVQT